MAELNPPFALQNAGATHTAEGDRLMLSGQFTGTRTAGQLVASGGVNMSIASALNAAQTGTPSMAVMIGPGICFVSGTESNKQGLYCCVNDSTPTKTVATAHGTLPRIDSVIARVYDSAYSGVTNSWALEIITGTPASSPTAPGLPANSLRLFNINVGAAVSSIVNANISDVRIHATSIGGIISCTSSNQPPVASVPEGQATWLRDLGVLQVRHNGVYVTRSSSGSWQTGQRLVSFTNQGLFSATVTFPTSFSATPRVFTNIETTVGSTARWYSRAWNITTTGFTLFVGANDTAGEPNEVSTWSNIPVTWAAFSQSS